MIVLESGLGHECVGDLINGLVVVTSAVGEANGRERVPYLTDADQNIGVPAVVAHADADAVVPSR